MGFLDLSMTVRTLESQKNNVEIQLTENSMELSLKQKQSSAKIEEIEAAYTQDAELIQAEMDKMADKTTPEYEELMARLKERQSERDRAESKAELESKDYQTTLDIENDMLEAQLEDINAELEAFKDARDEDIEQSAGYFQ